MTATERPQEESEDGISPEAVAEIQRRADEHMSGEKLVQISPEAECEHEWLTVIQLPTEKYQSCHRCNATRTIDALSAVEQQGYCPKCGGRKWGCYGQMAGCRCEPDAPTAAPDSDAVERAAEPLLPCPFCGGRAVRPNPEEPHGGMVNCHQCGAQAFGPKWNRRATLSAARPTLDEATVRRALEGLTHTQYCGIINCHDCEQVRKDIRTILAALLPEPRSTAQILDEATVRKCIEAAELCSLEFDERAIALSKFAEGHAAARGYILDALRALLPDPRS